MYERFVAQMSYELGGAPVDRVERPGLGQRSAGLHLAVLLRQPGPYRDLWEKTSLTTPPGGINQAAVCQVIAEYLWDAGERPETDLELARQLKDRVSRALSGKGISPETIRWFVNAFQLAPNDAQRVHELFNGQLHALTIYGSMPPPHPSSGVRLSEHETTLLFEHHTIGKEGLPIRHHTQQTIRSLVDGLESYSYRMNATDATLRVVRGGKVTGPRPIADGYFAFDIRFPVALRYGEEHYLDYWTRLHYSSPPEPEFRRGTHQRVQHLYMRVEFHPKRLPSRLWWAEWSDHRDANRGIVGREDVTLDAEHSAHRYLDSLERAIVGFFWEW